LERSVLFPGLVISLIPQPAMLCTARIARFIAGDPTAGNMTGGYLFKMWGLPAAALACGAAHVPRIARRSAAS
jgi:phosphotransferase system  glucose/maltose/N-acetylglucosamine-specific IIC component